MPTAELSDIRLTNQDLPEARLSSSQHLDSPTSPALPKSQLGWRDRWWLNGAPSQSVSIHYWIFCDPDEARKAAENGRTRLSSRRVLVDGRSEPIYQKLTAPPCGEICWQAERNILFVRDNIVILVAESGRQVPLGKMLEIANQIDARMTG